MSQQTVSALVSSPGIPTGGVITVAYPVGYGPGDFASSGHILTSRGLQAEFSSDDGEIAVLFGANIAVTYLGRTTIPAGTWASCDFALAEAGNSSNEVLDVKDFGALGTDTGDDLSSINAALAAANSIAAAYGGASIFFPPGMYRLESGAIVLTVPGVEILGSGATLKQMVWGQSFIQTYTDRSIIRGLHFYNPVTKSQIMSGRERAAGVYGSGATNTIVENCTFENVLIGTTFFPAVLSLAGVQCNGNTIRNNKYWKHDYGVLALSQKNLTIIGNQFKDTEWSQPTAPPHAVYISGDPAIYVGHENVLIANNTDTNNPHASSWKANDVKGFVISACVSDKVERGCDFGKLDKFSINGVVVRDMLVAAPPGDSQQAAISLDNCINGEVVSPNLTMPDNTDVIGGLVFRNGCNNTNVRGGIYSFSHTSLGSSDTAIRIVGSDNIRVYEPHLIERGSNKFLIGIEDGTGNGVFSPWVDQAAGNRIASIVSTAINTDLEIDPSRLNFVYSSASNNEVGTGTRLRMVGKFHTLTPQATAPTGVPAGTLAYSDGTAGASGWGGGGAGVYRWTGSAWVFVG